jgi:DNA-binding CsgD family transcriptional regulator
MRPDASAELTLAARRDKSMDFSGGRELVRCGAESVELSERFYRGIFLGITAFVGVAALIALVLLPLRAGSGGAPVSGVILGSVVVVATPLALWRIEWLYRALRRRLAAEIGVVLYAAALVAAVFPLRSQLWWPSCTLLMLVAVVAPIRRVLFYCMTVLAVNLLAHVLSGDMAHTPAVSIIGLWIGYIFWSLTVAAVTDQLAAHLMQLNSKDARPQTNARRVVSWSTDRPTRFGGGRWDDATSAASGEDGRQARPAEPVSEGPTAIADDVHDDRPTLAPAVEPAGHGVLQRLTARQLQVVALLADGLRYRDVAACLSISDGQVQRHVARAVARLGVSNATELVTVAIREGLVPPTTAQPPVS